MTAPNYPDKTEIDLMQAVVVASVEVIANPNQYKIDDLSLAVGALGHYREQKS